MTFTLTPKSQQPRKPNQPFLELNMQWTKSIATLVACFMAMVLTACGGGGSSGASSQAQTPITINTQAANQSVVAGQSATFSVDATSTETLSYQWKKNDTDINGATSSSYTTPPTTSADNGAAFAVSVSNGTTTVTSNATLTVTEAAVAPAIATQPADQTATTGQTATFSVAATGSALRYQWKKNGTDIAGATSSSYTTPATSSQDSGASFAVTVSNSAGAVTSSGATLTVSAIPVAPAIATQPTAQTVTEGQTATFAVTVTGTTPGYQWKKNGANIPGATSSTYTTNSTAIGDNNAVFSVVISNSEGTVTSSNATLTVSARAVKPSITTQPTAQSVTAGQAASFSVAATGTGPLTYQWKKNGLNISGAITSAYTTPATAVADNNAVFAVEVSNSAGTVTSITAALTVTPAPVAPAITSQPADVSLTAGQSATFSVTATGTAPLRYQWKKNGVDVTTGVGGTTSTYNTPATVDADNNDMFTVVVSNSAGTDTSSTARLSVAAVVVAPVITTQPAAQMVIAGQSATFSVTATGTSPGYQWKKNGTDIPGATSSTYTTPATSNADNAAVFRVVVSNSAGTVTSSSAALTVTPTAVAPAITTQPAPQAVTVGQTATFSVTATGTSPNYQWRKNGTNIPGATASSYTTPVTAIGDNAAVFTVEVSNSAGGVTSSNATLTVTPVVEAPTITTQLVAKTVTAGEFTTFSVTATGTGPLTYQWRKNGVNIPGATSSSYTIPTTSSADNNAVFTVVVSNSAGTVTSSSATLTVVVAPTISTQPTAQTVNAGQTATFSVTATGTAPLYQWRKNGIDISGATSSSYTTPATSSADNAAEYTVTVSNSAGTVTSSTATLTVNVGPAISIQPASQTVTVGQTVSFGVVATGTAPLSYQWSKNGSNISGATSSMYTTPATVVADSGAVFTVLVSNSVSSVTSNSATLTVVVAPAITTQPAAQTVTAGQTASFSVTATGTAPLSYQWKKNGTNISGATTSSYTTPATTSADNAAVYTVTVSNSAGSVSSSNATLTVNVGPAISIQPASQTVTEGQTVSFGVVATGTAPLTYQWSKNGINISGATSSMYTTPATVVADSGAVFTVLVSNSVSSVTSSSATLTVNPATYAPAITTQPVAQTVTAGQTATFSVTATGTAPLSYQWTKNGTNISGATASSYTTPATVDADSNAVFTVVISNSVGTVTSSSAMLTVNAAVVAPTITTQPADQTVNAGETATFLVTASGNSPNYQWRKNGTNIPGATASSYTTPVTTIGDNAAAFSVVVSNSAGGVTSNSATLTVNPAVVAPTISTQPAAQTVTVGQTATFSVTASGTSPNYQWRKNGTNISGATSSTYTTPATVSADNNAAFTVVVSNSAGTATSSSATLTVNVAPAITAQPTAQTVTVGQTASFSVTASGTAPLTYQWKKNGTDISGATSSSYTTPVTTSADNAAAFTVVVSNSVGSVTSSSATLTVQVSPTIFTQPVAQSVLAPDVASFSVVATGTQPFTYQWKKNGVDIAGATSNIYTTPATSGSDNGAVFTVVVSNSVGSVTSSSASLAVSAITIGTQPAAQSTYTSLTATFSVAATGTGTLTYQWKKNGTDISGATSSTYTTPETVIGDNNALYSVAIGNGTRTVTSNTATLTVSVRYSQLVNNSGVLFAKTECVKDNSTGLIWEGKTASGTRAGSNTYTNYDGTGVGQKRLPQYNQFTNATQAEIDATTNTIGYISTVNAGSGVCGYTDWRRPTYQELKGILASSGSPKIDITWFPNTQANYYWSSTPYVGSGATWELGNTKIVDFGYSGCIFCRNSSSIDERSSARPVRLVR